MKSNRYTISTRSLGDGSEACYVVYYQREIIATFPINDPSSIVTISDAREYAERFVQTMDAYMDGAIERLARR